MSKTKLEGQIELEDGVSLDAHSISHSAKLLAERVNNDTVSETGGHDRTFVLRILSLSELAYELGTKVSGSATPMIVITASSAKMFMDLISRYRIYY